MAKYKVIHDTVHGGIRLDKMWVDLVGTPEMMRLASIKQLGTAYLVFPGANHTRFEHSLGTGLVASRMARHLGLDEEEWRRVATAGLLHDLGHGPFSHALEGVLYKRTGKDHMDITKSMIRGEYEPGGVVGEWGRIPEILEENGLEPKEVAELVSEDSSPETTLKMWYSQEMRRFEGEKRYLNQIIHGVVDADQMDYLLRDAHYTGVALGTIDLPRLLNTLELFDEEMVVNLKGLTAVEGMLVARSLMYSSVYFHKTVRISQQMLVKAVERAPNEVMDVQGMMDGQLLEWLTMQGGFQRDMVDRIRYRSLYKTVYARTPRDLNEKEKEFFTELSKPDVLRQMEEHLARRAGIASGGVIVDIPLPALLLSEPRIDQTEIKVTDGSTIFPLSAYSTISAAVQKRTVPMWSVVVSTVPEAVEKVKAVVAAEFQTSSI
ncbi:MAG: HD domain-containing protein [Thermoplasmata archaeon]|nr:HD domain-containing protein [Thermoplasmata archaeon]